MLDVQSMNPAIARKLCRFCLKMETTHEPHYQLDWFKWPNSEVSRLFQLVVGEKLTVSAHLPELFCTSCQWWLKETNDKVRMFKENCQMWKDYLDVRVTCDASLPAKVEQGTVRSSAEETVEPVEVEDQQPVEKMEEQQQQPVDEAEEYDDLDADGFKIEYLEVDMYDEEEEDEITVELITDELVVTPEQLDGVAKFEGEEDDGSQTMYEVNECLDDDDDDDEEEEEDDSSSESDRRIRQADESIGWTFWNMHEPQVQCEMCGKQFKRKHSMVRHFAQTHGLVNQYSCTSCPKVFSTKDASIQHAKIHPLESVFKCEVCDKLYDTEYYLRRHQRSVHGPVQLAPCPMCNKIFFSSNKLNNHMQRHGEKKEKCDECGRKFHMKKDLKMHIEVVHQQIRRFVCDLCGHQFSCKVSLQSHATRGCPGHKRRTKLPDSTKAVRRELNCSECEMKCMRPETLRRHFERSHPDGDWEALAQCICVKCLRQFESVELIVEHNAKHHPVWQCDICKTVLTTELSLERHKKIHTAKERPFTCAVCEGTYVTQHQLKMHFRRKHTNERPFACPSCDRRYADRSEMNVHIRSAHGNERHQCPDCPKSFNSAKYLGLHVARDHTGQFNFFECNMCTGRYVNARVLAEHQAVHHPNTT